MAAKKWIYGSKENLMMVLIYYGAGIIFCAAGLYLFFKNMYEKDRSIFPAVIVILMGIGLIAFGAAHSIQLIK